MKKYDNYKDSGIEWIGEIPEHWKIQRLKYAFDLGTGLSITKENLIEKGVPCVNYGEIHSKYGFEVDINKHNLKCVDVNYLNTSKKALMNQGEFIFADTSEDIEGSGNFTHIKSNGDIFAGYHTITARPIKKSNSLYFAFLFDSIDFRTQIRNSVKGIKVFSITQGILKDTFIWHPSLEEQTAIANYLDHKTTQIDTLIAKKEQFISLLQEERTAVINQAVTKGLDPKANMKDSGIGWLGDIPEHWEVSRIKYVTEKIGSGVTPKGGAEVYETFGIPLLRSQNVYFDGFRLDNVAYITTDIHNSMNNSKVLKGDVLLNITGGSIGRCYFVTDEFEDANVNQHVCIVRPNEFILTEYLYYILSSQIGQLQIDLCQTGGNREALNFEQLKKFLFALPSIEEQTKLISKIQKIKITIDNTISKSHQEISLLKEYKTALISEVVTGKVDVREEILN